MELIPIRIEIKSNYDCLDVVVDAICNWAKRDYQMMFSQSWVLTYESKRDGSNIISKNLLIDRGNKLDYLNKYHGVDIKNFDFSVDNLALFIKEEIRNNSPVLLKVDAFWCPWMFSHYKVQHVNHFMIVNGYDEETGKFHCIDSHFAANGIKLTLDVILEACSEVLYIRLGDKIAEIDPRSILISSIDRLSDNKGNFKIGKMIEAFSEDFLNYMDLDKEISEYKHDPGTAVLPRLMLQAGQGRYKFSLCLEYIQSMNKEFQLGSTIKMLKDVSTKWNEVFAMLVKAYFLTNRSKTLNRIYLKLKEIKKYEEDIAINIRRIVNYDFNIVSSNYDYEIESDKEFNPHNYKFIDIKDYLNNNGIYKEESINCTSELSNPNRYFIPKFRIINNEISIGKMRFKINNFENNEVDNICCEGQEIPVNIDGYNKLMILMCSEFGNFDEKIEIYYDDNEKEVVNFNTTTWLSHNPREKNQVALPGKGVVRDNNDLNVYPFDVNIYGSFYNLRYKSEKIKKIKLPDCVNIHIFAITLGE